jgi:hypothetical protein
MSISFSGFVMSIDEDFLGLWFFYEDMNIFWVFYVNDIFVFRLSQYDNAVHIQ